MKEPIFDSPEEQRRYDEAYARISKDLEAISEEIRESTRISAKDLAIVINAR